MSNDEKVIKQAKKVVEADRKYGLLLKDGTTDEVCRAQLVVWKEIQLLREALHE